MASRSLNKVLLIGNVTRDPELRYTPKNAAVANFGVATNRAWTDASGQVQEQVEFTNIVVWSKLAEFVGQYVKKGRKVFVEGRLQTRSWESKEGEARKTTEVVAEQILLLDSQRNAGEGGEMSMAGNNNTNSTPSTETPLAVDDSVGELENLADDIPF